MFGKLHLQLDSNLNFYKNNSHHLPELISASVFLILLKRKHSWRPFRLHVYNCSFNLEEPEFNLISSRHTNRKSFIPAYIQTAPCELSRNRRRTNKTERNRRWKFSRRATNSQQLCCFHTTKWFVFSNEIWKLNEIKQGPTASRLQIIEIITTCF